MTHTPRQPADPGGFLPRLTDYLRSPLNLLLLAAPAALAVRLAGGRETWLFLASGVAIIPLAGLIGRATERLADRFGAGVGGLLNATLGNAAELILGVMALRHGPRLYPLVRASLTGSIIGNLLLVLGMSALAGGLRHPRQTFNRTAAGTNATLLALACVGLVVPTMYFYLFRAGPELSAAEVRTLENLSEEIAVVLAAVYGLSLLFVLKTHAHLFAGRDGAAPPEAHAGAWPALAVLTGATVLVAFLSEWLADSADHAAHALGMSPVFVGVVVVAVVGNAAEHSSAVVAAWRDRMDLSINLAVGSSIQVALFVAPALVFTSVALGHAPALDLHFTPLEVAALLLSLGVLTLVCHDGESNWLEGAMLLAVYLIFALAFYHLPPPAR